MERHPPAGIREREEQGSVQARMDDTSNDRSARVIQAGMRGRQGRREYGELSQMHGKHNNAASQIQSGMRGRKGRRLSHDLSIRSERQEDAARQIQAGMTGQVTRNVVDLRHELEKLEREAISAKTIQVLMNA